MTVEELVLWLCRWVLPIVGGVVFWLCVGAVLSFISGLVKVMVDVAIKERNERKASR